MMLAVEVMKTIPSVGENAAKRKAEESPEGGTIKRTCEQQPPSEPMYLYIPPSPAKEESSSESYYESLHGYETAFAKDTSDDYYEDSENDLLPGDILAIEETFDVEYEVDSDSDEDTKIFMSDSGSDSEGAVNTVITFVCKSDSDQEFWADKSSDEEFDSDLEIRDSDKWNCKRCGSSNNPPMRYCIKCWSMRSGWVVPKRNEQRDHPRRKPRSKKNKKNDKPIGDTRKESSCSPKPASSLSSSSAPELPSTSMSPANDACADTNACQEQLPSVSSDISSVDLQSLSSNSMQEFPFTCLAPNYTQKYYSNFSSELSSSSQELSTLSSNSSSQEFPSSSAYSSQESSSLSSNSLDVPCTSKEVINSLSTFRTLNLSTVPKCEADSKLCLLCCSRPANASIIHGKYAHQISCYRCAKKLQHENKRCPVCRRTIDRVVYQITAV
ncbi:E3 ubiquitin-protein ligase Mdm2 isoform X2 [Parasteatoda tepidariorum]|uniref:E3 ubiquitin-protein ligase Mdm2 isoform X2 n=1 Tax=Parasteatoda tepidariorum TaxID=114398 RepID=UPI00077FE0A1|nr:E3 ubiquitin-protein ligase Mdm2 isoform X2 [Parasteatoda tepidariorum]